MSWHRMAGRPRYGGLGRLGIGEPGIKRGVPSGAPFHHQDERSSGPDVAGVVNAVRRHLAHQQQDFAFGLQGSFPRPPSILLVLSVGDFHFCRHRTHCAFHAT